MFSMHEYYVKNRSHILAIRRDHYMKNRSHILATQRNYYVRNHSSILARERRRKLALTPEEKMRKQQYLRQYRETHREAAKQYEWEHRERRSEQRKELLRRHRLEVLSHYSNGTLACANPYGFHEKPFTDVDCLQLDHVNGCGVRRRKEIMKKGGGRYLYLWLKKNKYPSGYQVLCANCNWKKRTSDLEKLKGLRIA